MFDGSIALHLPARFCPCGALLLLQTREWREGLMSTTFRDMANNKTNRHQWIVLDGDIDAEWVESLNTVMVSRCVWVGGWGCGDGGVCGCVCVCVWGGGGGSEADA